MEKRRKLFSEVKSPRRKLFCGCGEPLERESKEANKAVVCQDCGYAFETASTTNLICPKCGGTRFNVTKEKKFSRRNLFGSEEDFQKEFNTTDNPLELKLKKYSGKSLSKNLFEKEFSAVIYGIKYG